MNRSIFLASLALVACSSPARAQLITFEQTPAGATPVDNSFLAAPYAIAGGDVRFFFDVNGSNTFDGGDQATVFERTGPDGSDAFTTALLSASDTPYAAVAAQLGDYFLRHQQPGGAPPALIVDYNTSLAISALSGEVWDIDGGPTGTEQWRADVLDAGGSVLATQLSPLGTGALTPLDGRPWAFSFSGLPSGVDKVRLTFVGSKTDGIGLAFNNFSPFTAVPEPSGGALALVAAALGCASWTARWRRQRAATGEAPR